MKKIGLLLLMGISVFLANAQKENGTVYIEHEAIAKTKAMWAAFVKGDKETYSSFFADSIYEDMNGSYKLTLKKDLAGYIDWWKGFENLSIKDDSPALPDAIEYKEGGLWVQDWLLLTGTHIASGINLKTRIHNLYSFDKKGKINSIHQYFDNDVFEEIFKSNQTTENGVVYKNHPYILTVRKAVNAYCTKKIDKMFSYYTPDAVFSNLTIKAKETYGVEEMKKEMTANYENQDNITLEQSGSPVCICYEKEYYVVHSWWIFSCITKDGKKISGVPLMLIDSFNKEGKIISEAVYYSSNHFQ